MNRSDVVLAMAAKAGLSAEQVGSALDALGDVLRDAAAGHEKVQITGLLTMEIVERAARNGRNPRTGEPMQIPSGVGVRLTAGAPIKSAARR